jgi:DNA-binding transcriptional ArsR family regulator
VRARLLGELAVASSAAGLASRVGLARQKVNYHLKALEAHGLVELAEERRHGGITERVLRRRRRRTSCRRPPSPRRRPTRTRTTTTCRRATSSRWPGGWCARSAPSPDGPAPPASACRP